MNDMRDLVAVTVRDTYIEALRTSLRATTELLAETHRDRRVTVMHTGRRLADEEDLLRRATGLLRHDPRRV